MCGEAKPLSTVTFLSLYEYDTNMLRVLSVVLIKLQADSEENFCSKCRWDLSSKHFACFNHWGTFQWNFLKALLQCFQATSDCWRFIPSSHSPFFICFFQQANFNKATCLERCQCYVWTDIWFISWRWNCA